MKVLSRSLQIFPFFSIRLRQIMRLRLNPRLQFSVRLIIRLPR